jgi:hypothetical protein
LQASAAVAALLADLQRREALLVRVRGALPQPVADHCVQATLENGHLTLVVDSPVWVDRLRLLAPQLCNDLAPELAETIQDFRVRAQPTLQLRVESQVARWYRGSASPNAVRSVEAAAAALGNSPLAHSLRRLDNTLERRDG